MRLLAVTSRISGVIVGVVVFWILLISFARDTGPVELVLWLVIGVVTGVVVTKLLRRGSREES